jgi:hypothetical protein
MLAGMRSLDPEVRRLRRLPKKPDIVPLELLDQIEECEPNACRSLQLGFEASIDVTNEGCRDRAIVILMVATEPHEGRQSFVDSSYK